MERANKSGGKQDILNQVRVKRCQVWQRCQQQQQQHHHLIPAGAYDTSIRAISGTDQMATILNARNADPLLSACVSICGHATYER